MRQNRDEKATRPARGMLWCEDWLAPKPSSPKGPCPLGFCSSPDVEALRWWLYSAVPRREKPHCAQVSYWQSLRAARLPGTYSPSLACCWRTRQPDCKR